MPDLTTLSDRQEYANLLLQMSEQRMAALADKLAKGQIQLIDFQITMREELRRANAYQLIAGAGGNKANVKADDWLKLGSELQKQYRYLSNFSREIQSGQLSAAQIAARTKLYARSSQAVFWKQALPVQLPANPRDGSTACRSNCLCSWAIDYEYGDDGNVTAVLATWQLDPTERHCPDCPERAARWNPLRIPVGYSFNQTAELVS